MDICVLILGSHLRSLGSSLIILFISWVVSVLDMLGVDHADLKAWWLVLLFIVISLNDGTVAIFIIV